MNLEAPFSIQICVYHLNCVKHKTVFMKLYVNCQIISWYWFMHCFIMEEIISNFQMMLQKKEQTMLSLQLF